MYKVGLALALAALLAPVASAQQDLVLRLEHFLIELGYPAGAPDGVVDDATHAAIRAYQRDRGLPQTGGLDLAGFQALEQEIVQRRAAASAAPPLVNAAPANAAPAPPAPANPASSLATTAPDLTTTRLGDLLYHRLASCAGERGMMLYTYRMQMTDPGFQQVSDICWHAGTGRLEGIDPEANLTPTRVEAGYEVHEVLASGAQSFQRTRVEVDRTNRLPDYDGTPDASIYITHQPATGQRAPSNGAIAYSGDGFLFAGTWPPQQATGPLEVFVGLRLRDATRQVCDTIGTGAPGNADLVGTIDPRAPQTVALRPAPGGGTGRASGTLTLSFAPDGQIRGSASVYFENPRTAGHGPCEWLRAEATLDTIVGTTTGTSGLEFRSIGIGTGRYTDVNGATYPLLVSGSADGYLEGF